METVLPLGDVFSGGVTLRDVSAVANKVNPVVNSFAQRLAENPEFFRQFEDQMRNDPNIPTPPYTWTDKVYDINGRSRTVTRTLEVNIGNLPDITWAILGTVTTNILIGLNTRPRGTTRDIKDLEWLTFTSDLVSKFLTIGIPEFRYIYNRIEGMSIFNRVPYFQTFFRDFPRFCKVCKTWKIRGIICSDPEMVAAKLFSLAKTTHSQSR